MAMEELARANSTGSHNNSTGSPADSSISSSDHNNHQQVMMMEMKKEEEALEASTAAVVRPATLSLPQLEVARPSQQQQEWMQDPFLTQLRSPWMENWSPYYASVLNF